MNDNMKGIREILYPKTLAGQLRIRGTFMLVFIGFLCAISLSMIDYYTEKEEEIEHIREKINLQGVYINKWTEERLHDVQGIANSYEARTNDFSRLEQRLALTIGHMKDFKAFHYLDEDGVVKTSTEGKSSLEEIRLIDREHFQQLIQGNDYISEVLRNEHTGEPNVLFSSPVKNDKGQIQGVIVGVVGFHTVKQVIHSIPHEFVTEAIFLVDQNGQAITPDNNRSMDTDIFYAAKNNQQMNSSYKDMNGNDVFGSYLWLNNDKWLLIGEIKKADALIGLHRELAVLITIIFILFIFLVTSSMKFSKKIEKPIRKCLQGADIIRSGKFDYRINMNQFSSSIPKELTELCHSFNQMVATLEKNKKKIEENDQRIRSLFHYNYDGVYSVDPNGKFISVNPACETISGYTKEELESMQFEELIVKEYLESANENFVKGLLGNSQHHDIAILNKHGKRVELNVTSLPMIVNGQVVGVYGIAKDITERKTAEYELQRMAIALEQSNKDLEQFAYVASHDLQEPLRMVTSYLQLLERRYKDELDDDANDFIYYAVDGAKRMQKLITDLLNYSRINRKGKPFSLVDIADVLSCVEDNLKLLLAEKHVRIKHHSLPIVLGDESQLIQLFQNLYNNAIKFNNNEHPEISIIVENDNPNYCLIKLSDNGIGIAQEHFERIFTIFQRLHFNEEYSGTGIGLAICKRIVERHGGEIWLESTVGKGTTINFTLPLKTTKAVKDFWFSTAIIPEGAR